MHEWEKKAPLTQKIKQIICNVTVFQRCQYLHIIDRHGINIFDFPKYQLHLQIGDGVPGRWMKENKVDTPDQKRQQPLFLCLVASGAPFG